MRRNADLVCLCANVTRQEIQAAAKKETITDLYEKGMCQWCRSCREEIEEILEALIQGEND